MTEATEEPKMSEAKLKRLKQQVSGVPLGLYSQAPRKPEDEVAKAETVEGRSAEYHKEPKAATSKARAYVRRSAPRKKK